MTRDQKRWFNLGKQVRAAECAGKDELVDRLIDNMDAEIDAMRSSARRLEAADFYSQGRSNQPTRR